jgi:hypothetical protein
MASTAATAKRRNALLNIRFSSDDHWIFLLIVRKVCGPLNIALLVRDTHLLSVKKLPGG